MIAGLQACNPEAFSCCCMLRPHSPALGPGPGFWQIRLGTPGALLRRQQGGQLWRRIKLPNFNLSAEQLVLKQHAHTENVTARSKAVKSNTILSVEFDQQYLINCY